MKVKFLRNHMTLPSKCSICGLKNEYWADKTYGCKRGHIIAFGGSDSMYGWLVLDIPIMEIVK